jgi:elastase-2
MKIAAMLLAALLAVQAVSAARLMPRPALITVEDTWVVGGQEVFPPGKYPYQGALENVPAFGQPTFNCGCVLVAPDVILTAAHCVSTNVDRYRFLVGAHDRVTQIDGEPTYVYARNITLHPEWDNTPENAFPNDIAVILLNQTVPDSEFIVPIALPEEDRTPDDWVDRDCVISGWGRTSGEGSLPNILRYAEIPVMRQAACRVMWSPYPVNEGHVCVYSDLDDKGACGGDSGGPLVCRESAEEPWELVGLTSWGASGCLTEYASVYTRVSFFRQWIDETLDDLRN